MRIVGVSTLWSHNDPTIWQHIIKAFNNQFPESTFYVEEEVNCHPWQIQRLRSFANCLVDKYDDGEDAVLVGHSIGGVIACSVGARMKLSKVSGIVTIFSPHRFLNGIFTSLLGASKNFDAQIISFGALRDELVWWGARHPQAVVHIHLPCNHFTDLVLNSAFAEQIAKETKKHLFP